MEEKQVWRWGVNRWILLGLIILGVILASSYPPIRPHIQLPAENLSEHPIFTLPIVGDFYLTNTLVATLVADVLLILIVIAVYRATKSGSLVPKGVSGAIEGLVEILYNLTEATAGKWVRTIFPYFAAITMLVLVVNWMELIPGVDSIGVFNDHHVDHAANCEFKEFFGGKVVTVSGDHECASAVIPFVRVASTDLNFTVALALVSLTMTQVIGVKALGIGYFSKFVYVKTLFSKPFFGAIDFIVGIFEIVSEFSKIISFSFRLFGNIFAGSVLLFVIGALIPVFAQSMVLILEFGVGLIQAIVFGMPTMVFMAQATQAHHDDEEH